VDGVINCARLILTGNFPADKPLLEIAAGKFNLGRASFSYTSSMYTGAQLGLSDEQHQGGVLLISMVHACRNQYSCVFGLAPTGGYTVTFEIGGPERAFNSLPGSAEVVDLYNRQCMQLTKYLSTWPGLVRKQSGSKRTERSDDDASDSGASSPLRNTQHQSKGSKHKGRKSSQDKGGQGKRNKKGSQPPSMEPAGGQRATDGDAVIDRVQEIGRMAE
jgi:hypothetical protein